MKKDVLVLQILIVFLSLACCGCLSVPNSPVPKFYMLQATSIPGENKQLDIPPKLIIGIGPVEIPEYQNRPQMVTQDKDGMLKFAQFERWGESLDSGLARLILENLTAIFPQADFQIFPCNFSIPLDYQIMVNVVQLESQLDKDILLTAQWTVINSKTKEMLLTKRSQIRQPVEPHTYSGIASALSRAGTLLSNEIGDDLSKLTNKSEAKAILAQ